MTFSDKLTDEVVKLMQEINRFEGWSKSECRAYAAPFCDAGQAIIGRSEQGERSHSPFGFAFWARIDGDTAKRLHDGDQDMKEIGLDGLGEGTQPWLVEVVCTAEALPVFLVTSAASVFPGETIRARLVEGDGTAKVIKITPVEA